MEKRIDKATERALEAYPVFMTTLIPADDEHPLVEQDCNKFTRKAYLKGYQQAEKDIGDPISWIKEISGVKEMTRAKEEALKAYPPRSIAANYDTIARRDAFEYGYIKAEKDLELTWEDLATIEKIGDDFVKHNPTPMSDEKFYKEVLKRFKERKCK